MGLFKSAKNANRMIREFEVESGLDTRSAKNLVSKIKSGTPFSDTEIMVIGSEAIRSVDEKAAYDPEAAHFDTIEAWKSGKLTFTSGNALNRVPGMTEEHVGYIAASVVAATRPAAAMRVGEALGAAEV